jgi:predicted ATP-grasp superfamily ATP-dependent carboligase
MNETDARQVLIVGVTTRALAVSAARAGYQVTAIDAFGDLDLRAAAKVIALRSPGTRFDADVAVTAGQTIPAPLVVYTSNLENRPDAVARLARGRILLGNPAALLARVRNPMLLSAALRKRGFVVPITRARPATGPGEAGWLLKPRRSGGGHGITRWHPGQPIPRHSYLQERISGVPGSVIFAADGSSAVILGLSRQLVGDWRFGARSFRYCGSLLGSPSTPVFARQEEILRTASALAVAVTRDFGLVGLNGLDFIARKGVPYPIEVNPRYSASMELLERAHRLSVFEMHLAACRARLPVMAIGRAGVEGKAVVFAKQDLTLGNTRPWLGRRSLADVPHPGEQIERGRPICTVFARGSDRLTCLSRLAQRANWVYRHAKTRRRQAA